MSTFEHIEEIKRRLSQTTASLINCYNTLMIIERVKLPGLQRGETMQEFGLLRTKAGIARKKLGVRFNQLFSSWELFFLDNCERKNEEALEAQEPSQQKEN